MLDRIHRSMPTARNPVLGLYGHPASSAVVLVYRTSKGAPIPTPGKITRYPAGPRAALSGAGG